MEEAEALSDRILIVAGGELKCIGNNYYFYLFSRQNSDYFLDDWLYHRHIIVFEKPLQWWI